MEIRTVIVAALFAASSTTSAQHAASFVEAQNIYNYQSKDASTKAYAETWSEFNNAHHLDEKDGCYAKAGGSLVQILEIDKTGKVIAYFADKSNGRSRCWRKTYLGVIFPAPPFAPYFHRLAMD